MGERYSGDNHERTYRVERDPLFEAKKLLDEINMLLAKLVEQGGDLTSQQKQLLRGNIQAILANLGLANITQLADFTASVHRKVADRVRNPHTPSDYPDVEEFRRSYADILREEARSSLPTVWTNLTASEVAEFAQYDWRSIEGRGMDIVTYSHSLGKVMSDELAYATVFTYPNDLITISQNWSVDNGRHRALTLRVLGERYTKLSGMDRWVTVQRDPDLRFI